MLFQGMTNMVLNFGMVFETFCAVVLIYFPYSYVIGFWPVSPEWWIPALPFSFLIWATDEVIIITLQILSIFFISIF